MAGNGIPEKKSRRSITGMIVRVSGYVLGVASLAWAFHNVNFGRLAARMAALDWVWVAPALCLDLFSYLSRGLRWRILLIPVGRLSFFRSTRAVYAGQFVNQVLPMRLGEVLRARIVANWLSTDFARVIPSVLIERLMDSAWTILGLGILVALVPLPEGVTKAGTVLGAVLAAAAVLITLALVERDRIAAASAGAKRGWRARLARFLNESVDELKKVGFGRIFWKAFGLSLAFFLLQTLTFWMLIRAYNLDFSFQAGAIVYLMVHVGTILPNAPGNVGVFQFFCIVALMLFHVEKTTAAGFSIVSYFLVNLPLWIIGFFALSGSGVSIRSVR